METKSIFFNNKYINNFEKSLNIEKQKSLKDQHFEKYYNHIFKKLENSSIIKTFSLTESSTNTKNYQNKQKSVNSSIYQPIIIRRNFKDPKNINYKLLKFNPYKTYLTPKKAELSHDLKNTKKLKKKEKENIDMKDINSITFYDIKFNKQTKIKNNDEDLPKNKNNINKNNKKNILTLYIKKWNFLKQKL